MPRTSPATHTPQTLENVLREIAEAIADIRSGMETMQTNNVESVRVETGQAELTRAIVGLSNFGSNLAKSIQAARKERGDFGQPINGEHPPKKRSVKKNG